MWNPRFWKLVELNGAQLNAARAATFRSKNERKRREHRRWKRDAEWFTGAVFQYPPLFTLSLSLSLWFFFSFFSFSYNIGRCCCKMQPRMSCENIDALWAATVYSGPRFAVLQGIIDTGFLSMGSRETSMDRRFLWNLLTLLRYGSTYDRLYRRWSVSSREAHRIYNIDVWTIERSN